MAEARSTFVAVVKGDTSSAVTEFKKFGGEVTSSASALDKATGPGVRNKLAAFRDATVAGFGVEQIARFGMEIFNAGNALQAMDAKSKVVFGSQIGRVKDWARENAGAMGETQSSAVAAGAAIADLLKPMGFSEKAATDQSIALLDLSAALSAWTGGQKSAAEVSQIFTKAMLGEREELKSLGISITEADVAAKLAEKGQKGLTGAALAQAKAIATQELIYAKSTDAQKAWADGSMDGVKAANESKASLKQLGETITRSLYPAIKSLIPLVQDTTSALAPLIGLLGDVVGGVEKFKSLGKGQNKDDGNFLGSMPEVLRAFWHNISDPEDSMNKFFGNVKGGISDIATFGRTTTEATQKVADFHGGYHRAAVEAANFNREQANLAETMRASRFRFEEATFAFKGFMDLLSNEEAAIAMQSEMDTLIEKFGETGKIADDDRIKIEQMFASTIANGNLLASYNFKAAVDTGDLMRAQQLIDNIKLAAAAGATFSVKAQMYVGASLRNAMEGRAAGGPVTAGKPYMTGETGREVFVPSVNGQIMNSSQTRQMLTPSLSPAGMPGSGGTNVNVTVVAPVGANMTEAGRQVADALRQFYQAGGSRVS